LAVKIVSIAVSRKKGTTKQCVDQAELVENHGIQGDAHAGDWHRQISFLASESIDAVSTPDFVLNFGDFAENIATTGIDWKSQKIGKECHKKCAIFYRTGDCIMPKEGVFGKILTGGTIRVGDEITRVK
jgi:MOSC domain-containing protein YiiM